jgi:hypothetical protein
MALTRTTQQKEERLMPMASKEAFDSILTAFNRVGRMQSVQEKSGRIIGSIGSGMLNKNNADVTVQVQPEGASQSKVVIIATAQEGLIPQNTAVKAISRLLEAIP